MGARPGIIAIGECMVELARGEDGRFALSYGGDTFNTAVYLARCGLAVSYATAIGDDPYSRGIVARASSEGIGTELIVTAAGRTPGLYLIETGAAGERVFHYWRDHAPARDLFDEIDAAAAIAAMPDARVIYLSGITLSLYTARGLDRLHAALARARRTGVSIAIDGNYRHRGWKGDAERARDVLGRFWRLADIALPTLEDEALLWGDRGPEETVARLRQLGTGEVVVKLGAEGALVSDAGTLQHVAAMEGVAPIDTTGAGDSFNAAYLAARLSNHSAADAARAGHRLAGIVVQHRGAIVPREATAAAVAINRADPRPGAPAP